MRRSGTNSAIMKIVMTLLVRDEEDILEDTIAYHLAQGVDFFIITDHQSTDRTPDILSKYREAGVAEVLHQADPGFYQGEWVTAMARRAATSLYSTALASPSGSEWNAKCSANSTACSSNRAEYWASTA